MPEPITIVGGGLAGLTLGIGLRQRGVPVTVWEAGRYPRHRVCGEFICGRGQGVLERLGMMSGIEKAGACYARNAAFFDAHADVPARALPQPALCLSRFLLDKALADEFQRLGGKLKTGERWHGEKGPGIVRASGKQVEPMVDGYRWIGLKAHARNVVPTADMELHFLASGTHGTDGRKATEPAGYVGLCRLAGNIVNVCGMFRSTTTFPDLSSHWRQWLTGPDGSTLHARLVDTQFDETTFCAVAGLDTRPRKAATLAECCIGDALTMIPPMTGNGMSMALEAAELATKPLEEYSRGSLTWGEAQRKIAQDCDARFARRLRWAHWLDRMVFSPRARTMLMRVAAQSAWAHRALFNVTR